MKDETKPKSIRNLSPDMIAALSAVLIGVCALGVSLYQASILREQAQLMREQQRASVWPNVAVENSYTGENFELRLVNTGIGPAKIGPVRVTFDHEPIRTWIDLVRKVYPGHRVIYYHSKIGDRVLPARDYEKVFEVSDPALADSLQTHIDRFAVEICYCSVYDECWLYAQRFDGDPVRDAADRCEATEDDFLD